MRSLEPLWPDDSARAARAEGWEIVMVVDNGKPVSSWYFMIFDCQDSTLLKDRRHAEQHVQNKAQAGSKLHISAMSAVMASRMPRSPQRKR